VSRSLPNPKFLILKRRIGQFIWIHLPPYELLYPLLCFVVIHYTARLVDFESVQEDRHRLPNNARISEEHRTTPVPAVMGVALR
jgi:hypothetical protein